MTLEMFGIQLDIVKILMGLNVPLSGAIIKIKKIGYVFHLSANAADLLRSAEKFPLIGDISEEFGFSFFCQVENMPAGQIMDLIHLMNRINELPGIRLYLKRQRLLEILKQLAGRHQQLAA